VPAIVVITITSAIAITFISPHLRSDRSTSRVREHGNATATHE
jgi:hypothetical protein